MTIRVLSYAVAAELAAMNCSTSAAYHAVTPALSLNGCGNLPSLTQRQMVAGLTGKMPALAGVVAMSAMRMMRVFKI